MGTLIVDDHALFSEGLRLLLAGSADVDAVCCATAQEAFQLIEAQDFELVLLDWNLKCEPSQGPLVKALKERLPHARVVIISGEFAPDLVREAIDNGAVGFIPKESTPSLMIAALTVTANGGIYLPPTFLLGNAPQGLERRPEPRDELPKLRSIRDAFPQLTARHADVLSQLARGGQQNKEIARALAISDGTVKQHLNAIFREIGVSNRTEAICLMSTLGVKLS